MMLKISNLFLSTIFLLCFYIDQIQLDDSLFENIKYLENEEVKLPRSSDWKDSNVVENEVLENIRNVLENFKNSPKEPYSVPHFEIIHHVFSEIINIIDNYFKGENLLKYSAEVPFIPLPIGGNNWETYESVLSKKLKKDYYPPTKIENNNKELIEALNMLITKVVDEYKITLNGYENKKEE
ncbi:uncharacterized protein LOC126899209 isoform X3 [Daktulosphaira vitifoliae]|uniref:uncharacterized protein LOC126899209 isoform X3 n=1 Tax=Daktulosphaira vitifoliae TaxID=58002 RepID=UPI0021A9AF7C|nr:uncharacterized protein LOC126899209 isoform X3 [Daktulosphaira vitifoliae]